jgi:2-amino-4-hydroxy-6-hydroxymethyldihydropteridine diphosphokinase
MSIAYVGLGSNLGDRANNIRQALDKLRCAGDLSVFAVSSLYETEPEGYEDQNWFVNAVAGIETTHSPRELLALFKEVERTMGRRKSVRWGPREIDLDILLYDQMCFESPDLTIPHQRMHQRAFVLMPLAEIAADIVHPVLRKTIGTLLSELRSLKSVHRLDE